MLFVVVCWAITRHKYRLIWLCSLCLLWSCSLSRSCSTNAKCNERIIVQSPTSNVAPDAPENQPTEAVSTPGNGYQWTALSVTTVGALLASIQGSALLIALPSIMADLHATFFTIMWVLLGYLLITTVLTPVVGRLADMWG